MPDEKLDLLEMLSTELKCQFLSDLRSMVDKRSGEILKLIEPIPLERCTLHTWNDALNYLVCEQPQTTRSEAKELLLRKLRE